MRWRQDATNQSSCVQWGSSWYLTNILLHQRFSLALTVCGNSGIHCRNWQRYVGSSWKMLQRHIRCVCDALTVLHDILEMFHDVLTTLLLMWTVNCMLTISGSTVTLVCGTKLFYRSLRVFSQLVKTFLTFCETQRPIKGPVSQLVPFLNKINPVDTTQFFPLRSILISSSVISVCILAYQLLLES